MSASIIQHSMKLFFRELVTKNFEPSIGIILCTNVSACCTKKLGALHKRVDVYSRWKEWTL